MSLRHKTEDNGKVVARGSKQLAGHTAVYRQRCGELTLTDCGLVPGKKLTPLSYYLGESLLSDSFHCQQDGFTFSLLCR